MVLLDWPLSREYFLSIFTHYGLYPTVARRETSTDMLRRLVANGFSPLNTPLSAFESFDVGSLKALTLEEDAPPLSLGPPAFAGYV